MQTVYTYRAETYCEDCGEDIRAFLDGEGLTPDNPNDETLYDSSYYPKPYTGIILESDYVDHCASSADCRNAITLPTGDKVGAFTCTDLSDLTSTLEAFQNIRSEYQRHLMSLWYDEFGPIYPEMETAYIQGLAGYAHSLLEVKEKYPGGTIIGQRPDYKTPEKEFINDLMYAVHGEGEYFPDDYLYAFTYDFLAFLSDEYPESDYVKEGATEWARDSVDLYTSDLTSWLGSKGYRSQYMDQVLQDFAPTETHDALMTAQMLERKYVAFTVLNHLREVM